MRRRDLRSVRMLALLGIIAMVVALAGGCAAPSEVETARITGTYIREHYSDDYLELHDDGTFYLKQTEVYGFQEVREDVTGEWDAEGNQLRLYAKSCKLYGVEIPMRSVFTLEIKGNKLIDPEGEAWVKR